MWTTIYILYICLNRGHAIPCLWGTFPVLSFKLSWSFNQAVSVAFLMSRFWFEWQEAPHEEVMNDKILTGRWKWLFSFVFVKIQYSMRLIALIWPCVPACMHLIFIINSLKNSYMKYTSAKDFLMFWVFPLKLAEPSNSQPLIKMSKDS